MKKTIAVLPGDGIGPEVTNEAVKILKVVANKYKLKFEFKTGLLGARAIEKTGEPLPEATLQLCSSSDAVLLGAVGDPKYDTDHSTSIRPEQGLLKLRKSLDIFANLRPIFSFGNFNSPLKPEITQDVDIIFVRELTSGIYFGEKGRSDSGSKAFDTTTYSKQEILRVGKIAFELAAKRKKKLTVADKANVLETSRLWRETLQDQSKLYKNIALEFMYVDNASMQILKNPKQFDVILTDNMFGDILTDEASVIAGSIGLLPSASIGNTISLYEPVHGSYPKAKGTHTANPIGTILSGALMLEHSFGLTKESKVVFEAVKKALDKGFGTKDLQPGNPLQTNTIGDKIAEFI